ncbi:hypothetical protein EA658_16495 [Pseudoxanthomonas winnipegensis]|uniref:Phage tail protein n=1 Tax=Pseudoxanthomonas winnipegensis TaxID=2480810 RepID=A0ABY1WCG5_9GAMM|nr:hypothetical protein [Pseudoxanthomonas winnipegensis]TAA11262.1 hypothetical protein EA659_07910 [Pseudoxanthomonas winnipegensis]TAA18685.1 hypothetical protein EA658_16495 [Pseudoxanthomonas winnipegensis]TAH73939.1 hypothetical protein EA657_00250 [Pseudoxanthomonas winnipegensis]
MFSLENARAKLRKVNPLSENHGPDIESGGSVTVEVVTSNEKLDELAPGLRAALCRAPTAGDQGSLLEAKVADGLTAVSFPKLGTSWNDEYPGYEVQVANGLGLEEPILLVDATVKNISWKLLDGGSVAWKFTIIAHPDAEEAGLLWHLQKREVELTLIPPTAKAVEPDLTEDSTDGADADDAAIAQEEADRLTTLGKAA